MLIFAKERIPPRSPADQKLPVKALLGIVGVGEFIANLGVQMRLGLYVFLISVFLLSSSRAGSALDEYSALKSVIKAEVLADKYPISSVLFIPPNNEGDPIEITVGLDDCGAYANHLGTFEHPPSKGIDLALIALRVVELEQYLYLTGLPKDALGTELRGFEVALLPFAGKANLDQQFKVKAKRLVRSLNTISSRGKGTKKIRFVEQEGECGAGEVSVKIKTQPTGGSIYMIPTFFFKACSLQGVDPYDRRLCGGWLDVVSSTSMLSGSYNYLVQWRDGSSKKGTFSCREACKTATPVVTLRK